MTSSNTNGFAVESLWSLERPAAGRRAAATRRQRGDLEKIHPSSTSPCDGRHRRATHFVPVAPCPASLMVTARPPDHRGPARPRVTSTIRDVSRSAIRTPRPVNPGGVGQRAPAPGPESPQCGCLRAGQGARNTDKSTTTVAGEAVDRAGVSSMGDPGVSRGRTSRTGVGKDARDELCPMCGAPIPGRPAGVCRVPATTGSRQSSRPPRGAPAVASSRPRLSPEPAGLDRLEIAVGRHRAGAGSRPRLAGRSDLGGSSSASAGV